MTDRQSVSPVEMVDILNGGTLLKREYGESDHILSLFHFAYNSGKRIELARFRSSGALDFAAEYWAEQVNNEDLPLVLEDASGFSFERRWYTIKFLEPTS